MPFVLKYTAGGYLKSKNAWNVQMTDELSEARVYSSIGAAKNSRNQQGRYNRNRVEGFEVVEVKLVEVSE